MDSGETKSGSGVTVGEAPPSRLEPRASTDDSGRPWTRRWWAVAAWIAAGLVLLAFFIRIAYSTVADSDGAANALQAWDMLHGHLLLHGWVIGDAPYYTYDLPVFALTEIFFGLHTTTMHIAPALTFLILALCVMAAARTNSSGGARAVRSATAIAILACGLIQPAGAAIQLQKPDHASTPAILLACFLLIDRKIGRRFVAPLIFVLLCAGQLDDATVLYVAVPAIVLVSAYRALTARKLVGPDAVIGLAAVLSVPAAAQARTLLVRLGAFAMIPPKTGVAPLWQWPQHIQVTVHNIRVLFGAELPAAGALGIAGFAIGVAGLLAVAFGLGRVVWRWRTASRAEQLICVAIIINLAVYIASLLPWPTRTREITALLPLGAVLAARALVPPTITVARRLWLAFAAAVVAALVPLTAAAAAPPYRTPESALAAWLEDHGLRYGVAYYWDASIVTVASGDRVEVVPVHAWRGWLAAYNWESQISWYNAKLHDATFVVAGGDEAPVAPSVFEQYLGRPGAIYNVGTYQVMVYGRNVLEQIIPGPASEPAPLFNGEHSLWPYVKQSSHRHHRRDRASRQDLGPA